MDAEAVLEEIRKDRIFYRKSGGGVNPDHRLVKKTDGVDVDVDSISGWRHGKEPVEG